MDTTAPYAPTTIGGALLRTAARRPEHEALVFPPERCTYRELTDRSLQAARSLAALGIGRGDHVGILMPNCMDYVVALLRRLSSSARSSSRSTRATAAPSSPTSSRTRDRSACSSRATSSPDVDFVGRLQCHLPGLAEADDPRALSLPAAPRLRDVVCSAPRHPRASSTERDSTLVAATVDGRGTCVGRQRAGRACDDPAIMMYTSGTTAMPKGCPLSHEAIVRAGAAPNDRFALTEDDACGIRCRCSTMARSCPLLYRSTLGGDASSR